MRTSSSNIRFLRSGVIGSMRAWLPSRRSTAHQRGAVVVTVAGQVRSARTTGVKGAERWIGIREGCCGLRTWGWAERGCCSFTFGLLWRGLDSAPVGGQRRRERAKLRGEGADLGEGLAAAGKK